MLRELQLVAGVLSWHPVLWEGQGCWSLPPLHRPLAPQGRRL